MIIKTFILAVLVIAIIHLTIRYLLQSNLLHKSKQIVSSTILEEFFTNDKNENEVKKTVEITETASENDINNEDDEENDYDLTKMKEELMDYIIGDKEIYKEDSTYPVLPDDTSAQTDSNYNLSCKNDDNGISKFFETKIDDNDYTLYTANEDNKEDSNSIKKKETGTDELGRWEYDNENVINGGDIDNGLKGYDLSESHYANIN